MTAKAIARAVLAYLREKKVPYSYRYETLKLYNLTIHFESDYVSFYYPNRSRYFLHIRIPYVSPEDFALKAVGYSVFIAGLKILN